MRQGNPISICQELALDVVCPRSPRKQVLLLALRLLLRALRVLTPAYGANRFE
jgi:hypothetical protein